MDVVYWENSWQTCLGYLQTEFSPDVYNLWISPLQMKALDDGLILLAPNKFVKDWVEEQFFDRIKELLAQHCGDNAAPTVQLQVGSYSEETIPRGNQNGGKRDVGDNKAVGNGLTTTISQPAFESKLNEQFLFESFVVGRSNELALAASKQVGQYPGGANNPLLIYGGVGLGKTHLMQAAGNLIRKNNPQAKVLYIHSERFVSHMVKSLQTNKMDAFKSFYRQLDALLMDDIQFFAGKERSQEELFHTLNALFEGQQQIIITCDRYPKEIEGLEERLKSRFAWGLAVAVEPPELETRVAILVSKAELMGITLPHEVAFFIGKRLASNVRVLEGALKRVLANAQLMNRPITVELAKEALKDLMTSHDKLVTIDNIIKTVADYFKVRVSDLLSKRRNRSVARPRQVAMSLAKKLTNHSLPEIGEAFGGRDHTTVLHACKKIKDLIDTSTELAEDYKILIRILST
ncbi:MAG: chromosomal replication initiator protein DnaA [Gammaproteobacteria bacterium]